VEGGGGVVGSMGWRLAWRWKACLVSKACLVWRVAEGAVWLARRLESELLGGVGTWRWPRTSSINGTQYAAAAADDWRLGPCADERLDSSSMQQCSMFWVGVSCIPSTSILRVEIGVQS